MLSFLRENRRILVCAALALAAGLLLGLALTMAPMQQEAEQKQDAAEVDRIGEPSILPETRVERDICYLGCQHRETVAVTDTSALVGMTRQELAAYWPDAVITSFTSELVRVVVSTESYCPKHLLLRADAQGNLEVCQMQTDTLAMAPVLELEVSLDGLGEEARAELQEGVLFNSLEEINHYLESMES